MAFDFDIFMVGAIADPIILNVERSNFGFVNVKGWRLNGDKKIVCVLTLREGKVAWDRNGISRPARER